jgi:hypothetical protein
MYQIKNKNKSVQFFLAVVLLVLTSAVLRAQSSEMREVIAPMQAGTAVIHAGTVTINLSSDIQAKLNNAMLKASYYVTLTAHEQGGTEATVEKKEQSFVIRVKKDDQNTGEGASIDFVVFVKETVPAMMHMSQVQLHGQR